MPDSVQYSRKPEPVAVSATEDRKPQLPLIDSHFDALLAKQRARNVLHNDRRHPTTMSSTRSSPPRHPAPAPRTTARRRVRHRGRQASTNDLLRSAVTELEEELILYIKKRRKLRNGAKPASEVFAERRVCCNEQSPSIPTGSMLVPLMDLVVNRRKSKLKSEVNDGLLYYGLVTLIDCVSSSVSRVRSSTSTQGQSNRNARLRRRGLSQLLGAFNP